MSCASKFSSTVVVTNQPIKSSYLSNWERMHFYDLLMYSASANTLFLNPLSSKGDLFRTSATRTPQHQATNLCEQTGVTARSFRAHLPRMASPAAMPTRQYCFTHCCCARPCAVIALRPEACTIATPTCLVSFLQVCGGAERACWYGPSP